VRRMNLIPAEQRRRTETDVGLVVVLIVSVVVIAGIGFSYVNQRGVLADRTSELDSIKTQRQQVEQQLQSLAEYEALEVRTRDLESLVQKVYASRTLLSEILGDVSLLVPEDVWFQTLNVATPNTPIGTPEDGAAAVQDGTLSVEGNTYAYEGVARFMVRLEQVPGLEEVVLSQTGQPRGNVDPDKDVKGFSMSAGVVNTQSPNTQLPLSQVELPDGEE